MTPHAKDDKDPADPTDPLAKYRAKRSIDRTPEPAGTVGRGAGRLFVVQQHAARRLHWDLRLELDGVLLSWAVPRGPSPDTSEKRLAVHVEDHPLEYADFEGMIPAGNYGAGSVIVWDRGQWISHGDPREGLEKGKLLFELKGYKLKGLWTLVKMKKTEKEWLLIKERDQYVQPGGSFPPESVLSGLTVEQLAEANQLVVPLREELAKRKVPQREVRAADVDLMLCETRDDPFSDPNWVYELKLDGWRIVSERRGQDVSLRSRNGKDLLASFPEIARALRALPVNQLVVDGEVVCLDESGRPDFQRLQGRARLSRAIDVKRAVVETPATLYVFDLLGVEGFDVRQLPLKDRKGLLKHLIPSSGPVQYLDHIEQQGEAFYAQVERMGLEGIIAKKADSKYVGGRKPTWLKIRAERTGDFTVVGFTAPKGSREGFGALHLAHCAGGKLVYAGRAGSGFTQKELPAVRERLLAAERATPACLPPVGEMGETEEPGGAGKSGAAAFGMTQAEFASTTWVEPQLVAEVRFTEWTDEGVLRHPVFVRFREDRKPEDCAEAMREQASVENQDSNGKETTQGEATGGRSKGESSEAAPSTPAPPEVKFSNLKKIFWPDEGYTKGDLIEYYREVSPWLLPYLKDRPLVLTRFPDGISGKSFYQKDAPDFIPEWIRTVRVWSEDTQREIDYFVCDNVETLLYIANLGTIPLHLWASRVPDLERTDWCVLDLDPKGAPFAHVIEVAQSLHRRLESIDLPHYVKTTGKTGLHILVPMGGQLTYEQSRSFGELLARLTVAELPQISTIMRTVDRRDGKVYVDYLQNIRGQTIVAPYSVRPLPGATVSAPLEWKEVNAKLDPQQFTIKTVPARLKKKPNDPMVPVLTQAPDIVAAIQRLSETPPGRKRTSAKKK